MSGTEDTAVITFGRMLTKAMVTDLEENPLDDKEQNMITVNEDTIRITVAPWKIITIKI